MKGRLENKVILVTGGSSGIGRVTAQTFAKEGAKVVIADINTAGGEETVKMVQKDGGEATFIRADVANTADVEALVDKTIDIYGQLNCAFNNAGVVGITAPTTEYTEDSWDHVLSVNLKGVWLCMKYEIPRMIKLGGGAIVNTSSILGLVATEDRPAYVASKHGIIGLTKAAALEYATVGVRVNAICPGIIRTESDTEARLFGEDSQFEKEKIAETPVGRLGTPSEIAEAAVWLCSDAASFVTGLAMAVDGGLISR